MARKTAYIPCRTQSPVTRPILAERWTERVPLQSTCPISQRGPMVTFCPLTVSARTPERETVVASTIPTLERVGKRKAPSPRLWEMI